MTNYSDFEVEDFLHDDFFIDWVLTEDPKHQTFWRQWLLENPKKQQIVQQARAIVLTIKVKPLPDELDDAEVNSIVSTLQQRLKQEQQRKAMHKSFYKASWFRVAATVCILVAVGFLMQRLSKHSTSATTFANSANQLLEVANHTSQSKLVRMSDGSLAVLKPGSRLKYVKLFQNKREVFLDGEAFFEVHKNHHLPFLVHSHELIVRVLGTSFTVKNLNNNHDIKVVVNTGRVLVYHKNVGAKGNNLSPEVILTPNQQVTYAAKQLRFKKEILSVPLILSEEIANKAFRFDNVSLAEVIAKIEKAYDVHIEYDNLKLGKISLTASLSDRPLDEKIKLLCRAINASCQFTQGRIIINSPSVTTTTATN